MNWFDKIVTKIGLDKIAHMFIIAFIATILAMIFLQNHSRLQLMDIRSLWSFWWYCSGDSKRSV